MRTSSGNTKKPFCTRVCASSSLVPLPAARCNDTVASIKPGAAEELNVIATRLQSQYGKGKGTLEGKAISGSDIEEAMCRVRDPEKLK